MKRSYLNVIRKDHANRIDILLRDHGSTRDHVLNIGASDTSYGHNCINLDIRPCDGVHVIGDAHHLPFASESFHSCVLSAVLQYCRNPFEVAAEIRRILMPGGLAIIDVPFIQPYCGPADLFRFSREGLEEVFRGFKIVANNVSIPFGSSMAFYLQNVMLVSISNRYLRFIVANLVSALLLPVTLVRCKGRHEISGAFVLVCRKPPVAAEQSIEIETAPAKEGRP